MNVAAPQAKAPAISTAVFGGVFDIDGAGHYPGLELVNFLLCCPKGILPIDQDVRIRRVAHDFARRLIRDESLSELSKRNVLLDIHSEQAVGRLLRCLELNVANIVKAKAWQRTHFFPFTRSLVHWDARLRGGQVLIERLYMRGGGAYAFSVLRTDPDHSRAERIRSGLESLYPSESNSPLEKLASTLQLQGKSDEHPVHDQVERASSMREDAWDELFREGIANILSHEAVPSVQRVKALVNWTGLWLVLLESGRAGDKTGIRHSGLIVDCAGTHGQLRRASQKSFRQQLAIIESAVLAEVQERSETISAQQLSKIRGFFGSTAATCGLLNSWKGRRHFTLKLDAIETLVLAAMPAGDEMDFEAFVSDWLYHRCSLIVGRQAAGIAGLLNSFDATIFEENERSFAQEMRATGMLKVYSDATRMVSAGDAK